MRLITSTSPKETAEQFWVLRSLAERLAAPVKALLQRRRTLAAYEQLSPHILEDIGLPTRTVIRAKADGASLADAARRERADAAWSVGGRDPFGARVPFARVRRSAPTRNTVDGGKVSQPAPQGAERINARVPFARARTTPSRRNGELAA